MLGQLRENQLALMLAQPQLAIESPEPPPGLETQSDQRNQSNQ